MRMENGGGDQLARGMSKASFRTAGSKVTQEKWDAIWAPEVENEERSSDSDTQTAGNVGLDSGILESSETAR